MLDKLVSRAFKFRLKKPYSTHVYDMARGKTAQAPARRDSLVHRRYFSEEVRKAQAARGSSGPSLFERIISRELPADILYEDERCVAFSDVSPQAPVHFLVVPKRRVNRLEDCKKSDAELLAHLVLTASQLGRERAPGGFRLVVNNGRDGAQSVEHLHLHVLGGRQMGWPPG